MLDTENTLVALRVTAFGSSLLFAAHYLLHSRRCWHGFVFSHAAHLGFILWLGIGLRHHFGTFALVTGGLGYLVLGALAVAEVFRPGAIERHSFAIHFLYLNLLGTYLLQIYAAVSAGRAGSRIHSFVGAALLLVAAAGRWRGGAEHRQITQSG